MTCLHTQGIRQYKANWQLVSWC